MERYDESTGQVYTETTTPVQSMKFQFLNKTTGWKEGLKKYRNRGPGPASLYEMALHSCAYNADRFLPETLKYCQWHYGEKIYRYLKQTDTETAMVWSIFKAAYPKEIHQNSYHVLNPNPAGVRELSHGLEIMGKQLLSLSLETLSFLCVSSYHINSVHLNTDLLNFPNLAVLVLTQKKVGTRRATGGDSHMIQCWGRAVHEKRAFTRLRVLALRRFDISLEVLMSLSLFPALYLCNLDSEFITLDLRHPLKKGRQFKTQWKQIWPDRHIVPPVLESSLGARQTDLAGRNGDGNDNSNPETTWQRLDFSVPQKMDILYDIAAARLEEEHSIRIDRSPVVALQYRANASHHDIWPNLKSISIWLTRSVAPDQQHADPKGQPQDMEANTRGEDGSGNKRRKVREGKQKDIRSLLEIFAHQV
ncbi:uncharacterized protein BDR25DRAFT_33968 [Lindgomyces ingoldianus]|uniref:Uncharacterized protein n=1 Tax=Lindgomyces ingoldianus TaxID=673940 RepID=A0ACB6QTZ4_9PLEO|nr:uncharacterized protein BDR25DRAFT_33968 [Lindgomyces ingoldianus]KAF2470327.1 hypothetical protein BDR25DRAFT_33968 [Lindgomyces ingoldianus]